jgi:hypothetical protein
MEARTALGLLGGYSAKVFSIPATLLLRYKSNWQQYDRLLYY